MKTAHHKLVRDRIPEIIEAGGAAAVYSILTEQDYLERLDDKLQEELGEYLQDKSMEELADLLEVIRAVIKARGSTYEQVEEIRKAKLASRGGFEKRILLQETQMNEP